MFSPKWNNATNIYRIDWALDLFFLLASISTNYRLGCRLHANCCTSSIEEHVCSDHSMKYERQFSCNKFIVGVIMDQKGSRHCVCSFACSINKKCCSGSYNYCTIVHATRTRIVNIPTGIDNDTHTHNAVSTFLIGWVSGDGKKYTSVKLSILDISEKVKSWKWEHLLVLLPRIIS